MKVIKAHSLEENVKAMVCWFIKTALVLRVNLYKIY